MNGVGIVRRWLKFNGAGILGAVVQIAALTVLTQTFDVHYLLATAIAVETAVLHNFCWHERVTFAERAVDGQVWKRLVRFNLSNGLVSILGNVVLMKFLVDDGNVPQVFANVLAIGICSTANFLVSEWYVFAPRRHLTGSGLANEIQSE